MKRELRTAYFAGLIDGEGCIGLHSHGRGKRRRFVIKVKMTCLATVLSLQEHFQLGFVEEFPSRNKNWKDQWRWTVTDKSARKVAEQIRPYLITKAADLERASAA